VEFVFDGGGGDGEVAAVDVIDEYGKSEEDQSRGEGAEGWGMRGAGRGEGHAAFCYGGRGICKLLAKAARLRRAGRLGHPPLHVPFFSKELLGVDDDEYALAAGEELSGFIGDFGDVSQAAAALA